MNIAALELDFRSSHHRGGDWARWLAWLALIGTVLGVAALADHAVALGNELDALQAHNQMLQARLRPSGARKTRPQADAEELRRIERVNGAIDKLSVPWHELLQSLESVRARRIGLLSLIPNAQDHSLRLSGEAGTVADLMAYVERVTALPALAQVHLLGYETVPRDGAVIISFTLSAQWLAR